MVHIESIGTLCDIIESFIIENIDFQIIGHSYEDFIGVYTGLDEQKNNKWHVKLVILSTVGQMYYSETFRLDDVDNISKVKDKLATLPIKYGKVSWNNGIIKIQ